MSSVSELPLLLTVTLYLPGSPAVFSISALVITRILLLASTAWILFSMSGLRDSANGALSGMSLYIFLPQPPSWASFSTSTTS